MKITKILFLCIVLISFLKGFDGSNPPEIAISACLGKSIDARCSVYINGKDKKGTCSSLPNKEYLACITDDNMNLNDKPKRDILFTPIKP